ncbi:MAG: choice-of-anchor D domain-containing protein, partial [Myxococcota bacterium]|nr:choice-of-anchor D domain-containing protein [Myxococcota bacterium]
MYVLLLACSENNLSMLEKGEESASKIEILPDRYHYGEQPTGSAVQTIFSLRNSGTASVNIDSIRIMGSDSFAILSPLPTSLAAEAVEPIEVLYTSEGVWQEGVMEIESSDTSNPLLQVPLYGDVPRGALLLSPNPLNFGFVPVESISIESIEIRNVGGDMVNLENIFIDNPVFDAPQAPTFPLSLLPSESLQIPVRFRPDTEDTFTGSLWLQSSIGSHMTPLMGTSEETVIEEEEEDPCLDPNLEFAQHPEAKLRVNGLGAPITAEYAGTGAGYTNELWLAYPSSIQIAVGHHTPEGTTVSLGI